MKNSEMTNMFNIHTQFTLLWIFTLLWLGGGNLHTKALLLPAWWGFVALICYRRTITIPTKHMKWLVLYSLWWIGLMIPLPLEWLPMVQGDLGLYREAVHTLLNQSSASLALEPGIHWMEGSLPLLGYSLYRFFQTEQQSSKSLQVSIQSWQTTVWAVIFFFCLVGLLQHGLDHPKILGIWAVPLDLKSPFFSSFINGNHAGYLLACGILLTPRDKVQPLISVTSLLILGYGIWLCESRGAWFAGLFAVLYPHLPTPLRQKMGWLLFLIPCFITFSFTSNQLNELSHGRIQMWKDGLQSLSWVWVTGTGFGGFGDVYNMVKTTPEYIQSPHLHMEYLEWIILTGLSGCLIFLVASKSVFHRLVLDAQSSCSPVQTRWSGVLILLLCASFIDFPLRLLAVFVILPMALAFASNAPSETQRQSSTSPLYPLFIGLSILGVAQLNTPIQPQELLPQNSTVETQLKHAPLNPTLLEQWLWNKTVAMPTKVTDPFSFANTPDEDDTSWIQMIDIHARHYSTNIEAQRLQARILRRLGHHSAACEQWYKTFSLETPIIGEKNQWLKESLACDPNLWNVLVSLPDDVAILISAAKIFQDQQLPIATEFALQRAVEIETHPQISALHLSQWYLQQGNSALGWQVLQQYIPQIPQNFTTSERCLYFKVRAELGFSLQELGAEQHFDRLQQTCGAKPYLQNRRRIAGLRSGDTKAIQETEAWLEAHPEHFKKEWELLVHAYAINKETASVCKWIEKAFHQNIKTLSTTSIESCALGKMPSEYPNIPMYTTERINLSLQK